jgi:hypothetical protein
MRGVYWALAKCKKGFSKVDKELRSLLIVEFNDHPHIILSPNAKDMLLIKNTDGEKIPVWKILTQAGLGTISLNIVCDNSTIKQKVGKHSFRYIISTLGCV